MFDVFTSATGTIGTYPTLDKAVVAAKKLGRTAQIFNTNNPFKVVKTVVARQQMIKFYILAAIGAAFAAAADSIVVLCLTTAVVLLLYKREQDINGN